MYAKFKNLLKIAHPSAPEPLENQDDYSLSLFWCQRGGFRQAIKMFPPLVLPSKKC